MPTNFGLKFNRPKLGIQYHFKENPKASFVHEINLSHITEKSNPGEITRDLFEKTPIFLDPNRVTPRQVERLMIKMIQKLYPEEDKENSVDFSSNVVTSGNKDKDGDEGWRDIASTQPPSSDNQMNFENNNLLKNSDMPDDLDEQASPQLQELQDVSGNEIGALPEESMEENDDDTVGDVIDIDNEEELAARGLRKIQIEGEEEEFLMDDEGNIYNLNGEFIGATNEEPEED